MTTIIESKDMTISYDLHRERKKLIFSKAEDFIKETTYIEKEKK